MKKFELTDGNFKKSEEDRYKIKNDIMLIRSSIEQLTKSVTTNNDEQLSNIKKLDSDSKNDLESIEKSIKEDLDAKLRELSNFVNSKLSEYNNLLTLNNEEKEIGSNKETIEEEEKKKTEDNKLTKKVNDLERAFKIFNTTINIEQINKN